MNNIRIDFEYEVETGLVTDKIFSITKGECVTVREIICEALFDIGPRKVPNSIVLNVSDPTMLLNDNITGVFTCENFKVYEFNAVPKEDCDLLESPTFAFISKYGLPQVVPYARTYALISLDAEKLIVRGESKTYGINVKIRPLAKEGVKLSTLVV